MRSNINDLTISRIAAGEVVERPMNAVKELLENCLDAGARCVRITVANGGRHISIEDDGGGIHADDMGILCERFTTSKLRSFEDLQRVTSFGFRGEALSSVSYVARVTVSTRTAAATSRLQQLYMDGQPVGPAKSVPGPAGTTIVVEDLFHNLPTRRAALAPPQEEYQRISSMVAAYAASNLDVAFLLSRAERKSGGARSRASVSQASRRGVRYGNAADFRQPVRETTRRGVHSLGQACQPTPV